jgi:hypothetical protein
MNGLPYDVQDADSPEHRETIRSADAWKEMFAGLGILV